MLVLSTMARHQNDVRINQKIDLFARGKQKHELEIPFLDTFEPSWPGVLIEHDPTPHHLIRRYVPYHQVFRQREWPVIRLAQLIIYGLIRFDVVKSACWVCATLNSCYNSRITEIL